MKLICFFLLATLCVIILKAQDTYTKKVAVYVQSNDVDDNLKNVIGDAVTREIAQTKGYTATERTADFIQELLPMAIPSTDFEYKKMIAQIGQKMGVDFVCLVNLIPQSDTHYVAAWIVDVLTGIARNNVVITDNLNNANALTKKVKQLSNNLVEDDPMGYKTINTYSDCALIEKNNVATYISKTEITNVQYVAFLNANNINLNATDNDNILMDVHNTIIRYKNGKWQVASGYEKYPAVYVTWFGASEYCAWAGGQLPTKDVWIYTAKGADKSSDYMYAGSNNIDNVGWYKDNSGGALHPVATKTANEFGIYDMTGNVWEWCMNWHDADKTARDFCGGSWSTTANRCTVTSGSYIAPNVGYFDLGFRIVFPQ